MREDGARPRSNQALLRGLSSSPLGVSDPIDVRKGGNVTKKLTRIAPWQAGKLFAVVYFILSLIFVVPMELIALLAPTPAGPGRHLNPALIILFPFLYALAGLLFVPLGCWIYNLAAKLVGGLDVTVTDSTDA
jgi:hypothetical protein